MWHYVRDGEKHGPVTKGKIQQLVDEGKLTSNHLVWCSDMDDWKQISNVDDGHPTPPPLPEDKTVSSATESVRNTDAGTVQYAGFGSRLIAQCIDLSILTLIYFVLLVTIDAPQSYLYSEGKITNMSWQYVNLVKVFIMPNLIGYLYYVMYEISNHQATPGKQVMNVKITNMSRDKIGFIKATGRHFGKILSGAILLIGFVMAAFTKNGQALHDRLAGCLVVRK